MVLVTSHSLGFIIQKIKPAALNPSSCCHTGTESPSLTESHFSHDFVLEPKSKTDRLLELVGFSVWGLLKKLSHIILSVMPPLFGLCHFTIFILSSKYVQKIFELSSKNYLVSHKKRGNVLIVLRWQQYYGFDWETLGSRILCRAYIKFEDESKPYHRKIFIINSKICRILVKPYEAADYSVLSYIICKITCFRCIQGLWMLHIWEMTFTESVVADRLLFKR